HRAHGADAAGVLRLHRADRLRQALPRPAHRRGRHHAGHPDRAGRDRLHHRHHAAVHPPRQQRVRPPHRRDPEGGDEMNRARPALLASRAAAAVLALAAGLAHAAGGDVGQVARQPTNWIAIGMFTAFVVATLYITKWAARRTRSAADFYTAGGGITGF